MSTTYKQLYQKVLLRLNKLDGRALLAAKESVNDAQRIIARVEDFEELMDWQLTAATVDGTKRYHLETDLTLTRPKDIYSVKLMDETNSRKLKWIDSRTLDRDNPYPEGTSEQRSLFYTVRGSYLELIPIPDAAYTLHIYYSKWPLTLSADSDVMSFNDTLLDVIVALAAEMAMGIIKGQAGDWTRRAKELLGTSVLDEKTRPDADWVARPFNPIGEGQSVVSEYWRDPFIRGVR